MRRHIDLSTPVVENHFRWPVERKLVKSHEAGDHVQATWAGWIVHGFTHMDSPKHFVADGFTTDHITLDMTCGPGAVVDVSDVGPNEPVTEAIIAKAGAHVREGDFVLLRNAWDLKADINTPDFWATAPYMTREASIWLREKGIKAIGYDFPQDYCIRNFLTGDTRATAEDHVTHWELLRHGVIMFEYLCNMHQIQTARPEVIGLPVKLPTSDGAPARVIAIEDV
jgi:arylformamidase